VEKRYAVNEKNRLWPVFLLGAAGAIGHTFGVRVQKIQRVQKVQSGKVLKFDGAFGPEGCGLPFGQYL
jgi:hypothetical protein